MTALTGIVVGAHAALDRLLDPAVRIVTLTVTEKGYWRDADAATIPEDSMPGLLAVALHRRRATGVAPFTVLSCDNLPANGATTRDVVTRFAARLDRSFGHFVADEVAFPDCMVDRIVPATTPEDRARIDAELGMHDAWPVVCEPFTQWVIEDRFPQGRPAWERTGAELVARCPALRGHEAATAQRQPLVHCVSRPACRLGDGGRCDRCPGIARAHRCADERNGDHAHIAADGRSRRHIVMRC